MTVFLIAIVILILTLILFTPILVSTSVYFDLDRKTVILKIGILKDNLIKLRLYFENESLMYSINGRNGLTVNKSTKKTDNKLKINIFLSLFYKFNVKSVYSNFKYGANNDAYNTALVIANIRNIYGQIINIFNIKQNSFKAYPNYDVSCGTLDIKTKFTFTVFDLIVILIKNKIYKKNVENG
ncbi:MAG: hypothetical protein RR245_02605 [Clostridia bacterium]